MIRLVHPKYILEFTTQAELREFLSLEGASSSTSEADPPKDYATALVRISNQDAMLRNLRARLQAKEEELLQWQGSVKPQNPG